MTIVLVHGAWGGAWGWKEVARQLRSKGFEVYAPTLTGLAERSHVPPERVSLASHIADIAGLMRYEDLRDVVLVGHSYGGMVITGAADREPERVAGMVYLDAFLPESGESLWDIVGAEMAEVQRSTAEAHDQGKSVPLPPGIIAADLNQLPKSVTSRITPHPTGTLSEKFVSVRENVTWPRRHYILCTADGRGFQKFADRAKAQGGWEFSEFDAGHDVPRSNPNWVADRVADIARGWGINS